MRRCLALCWVLLALPADAAVYRCEVNGRPVYTDQPCGPNAAPHRLPAILSVPAGDAADLARDSDARAERERAAHRNKDAAWLKSHEAAKAENARMDAAIAEHKVLKGMSADQVRRALGRPDEVERGPGTEQWTYGSGKARQIIDFENDRVKVAPAARRRR